jgi:hypothetical protein
VPGALIACDVAALASGILLSREAGGDLMGLLPPLGGFGIGLLIWALLDRRRGEPLMPAGAVGAIALLGAIAALVAFLHGHFTWAEVGEDERHLFGWTLDVDPGRIAALAAPWKENGDPQIPFSAAFEQIAFGLFPWVALAPIALFWLALGSQRDPAEGSSARPAPWAGHVLFAWAALALLITAVVLRKVGPVLYPAVAAVTVAIGIWIDEILTRRERAMPLVALFALLAASVIGKDIAASPEELTSLTALGSTVKYPEGAWFHRAVLAAGALFGLCAFAGLFLWRGPYRLVVRGRDLVAIAGRHGLQAAIAVAVVFALFLSHVWVPGLSARMSSRDVLSRYRELKREGDVLGILGNLGSGPSYYAGDDYEKLTSRGDLIKFLRRPERVFALTRASEVCPLHKDSVKKGFTFHVLDDENVQFRLLSNQLPEGEKDLNPLVTAVRRSPPEGVRAEPLAVFEEQIELIGVKMPASVGRGDKFDMTLIYKVVKPVTRPWKVFVHIDYKAPPRIIGDHGVAGGHCPMSTFQPGDYIVDQFEVKAGDRNFNRGKYTVWTGFFVGGSGQYTNMKVTTGKPDDNNRVEIGTIEVR